MDTTSHKTSVRFSSYIAMAILGSALLFSSALVFAQDSDGGTGGSESGNSSSGDSGSGKGDSGDGGYGSGGFGGGLCDNAGGWAAAAADKGGAVQGGGLGPGGEGGNWNGGDGGFGCPCGGTQFCGGNEGYSCTTSCYECPQSSSPPPPPPAVAPGNLSGTCTGTSATISWNPVPGATSYGFRVDNVKNAWAPGSANPPGFYPNCTNNNVYPSGDICSTHLYGGTSFSFTGEAGAGYTWWVHGYNSAWPNQGWGPATGASFQCSTECSDGADNGDLEDSLSDRADNGCWTDPNDSTTYDPNDNSETYIPPVTGASCTVSPDPQLTNQTVTWSATAQGGGGLHTCLWSGAVTGSGCTKTASYSSPGTKSATVTISGGQGGVGSASDQCSVEVKLPQCSNGTDDPDEDDLSDTNDPGCHSDNIGGNSSSYNPNDNDESDASSPLSLSIDAVPTLVEINDTSTLRWTSINAVSCTVTGTSNGGSWSGTAHTGQQTNPLSQTTVFTLRCVDVDGQTKTDSVTVRINSDVRED